ncbi:MAG: ATP-binding protein [Thermodesulfobacteriota bacterium]|nr:ATP-binding protein [Thermodesulfobacteriota bacterium]
MDSEKEPKSIRLQTRLILYSTLLILFLMALVVALVEKRQTETIQEEAKKRGMAIARNLAAVSTNALLTYNYIVLGQSAERVVLEADILYVIIHDKEDKVAAYSQHDEKQGLLLTDEVSKKAVLANKPLIQSAFHGEKRIPILDISIPVYIKESQEKWGTIRIGLSLEGMSSQILKTRLNLLVLGIFAIVLGILGSIFFARRITQPISNLVGTTIAAAKGDLEQVIDIHTGDEIEELGKNFNHMIRQIRLHQTELENRLREITSLKAYNDNILSSMTNGLITIDLEEKIVTLNEMAERILEKRRGEIVGLPLERVLGEDHPFYRMMRETLSREEGIFRSEMELKKDEESLWLTASTSLLTDGEGKKIGVLVVFQDITEIKALEEELRQADRLAALGTLSAGLAHEIKNPLSAIKTFVQLLPKKFENLSFMEKFNVTVPREIDRINQLVEDLLELTRRRVRPFVSLDANRLILQVIDLHGEEMRKKQIHFEDHLDRTLPPIDGDSETLYRAFSNLAINAIQAMPNGGSLVISSDHDQASSMVKIIFRDTGIGMEEETSKNLFNPFFTTKDKGVGLGMSLTRKIIEDHRGTIEVTSEKGRGTTFILRLPVVKV